MEITIKINGQAVSVEVSLRYMSTSKKATARRKIYSTKSGGTGTSESMTSILSLPSAATIDRYTLVTQN